MRYIISFLIKLEGKQIRGAETSMFIDSTSMFLHLSIRSDDTLVSYAKYSYIDIVVALHVHLINVYIRSIYYKSMLYVLYKK